MEQDVLSKYVSCKNENEALQYQIEALIQRNIILTELLRHGKVKVLMWKMNCDGGQVENEKYFTSLEDFERWLKNILENTNEQFGYEIKTL